MRLLVIVTISDIAHDSSEVIRPDPVSYVQCQGSSGKNHECIYILLRCSVYSIRKEGILKSQDTCLQYSTWAKSEYNLYLLSISFPTTQVIRLGLRHIKFLNQVNSHFPMSSRSSNIVWYNPRSTRTWTCFSYVRNLMTSCICSTQNY